MAIPCLLIPSLSQANEKSTPWVSDTPKAITLRPPPNESGADVVENELFDKSKAVLYRAHAQEVIWFTMGNCTDGPKGRDGRLTIKKCRADQKSSFPGPKDYIVIHVATPQAHWDTYKKQGVHPSRQVSFSLLPFPDVRTLGRSDAFPIYLLPHFGQTLVLR